MSRKDLRLCQSLLVAVLVLLAAPTACKKKPPELPPVASEPARAPETMPAPAPAGVTVSSVTLGKAIGADKKVSEPTESFARNDTIYASVATTGTSPSADLGARWTYEGANGSTLVKEDHQAIAPTGDATTEFHIAKPDGWPAGDYKVEITLDGHTAMTKMYKVG
jgi:hypothetical protein